MMKMESAYVEGKMTEFLSHTRDAKKCLYRMSIDVVPKRMGISWIECRRQLFMVAESG